MRKAFKNEKGFTLIELAIVLVIIGIIIGAVLKGQDLVDSARHKKLTTEIKQWEVATWTYMDRKGRLPGDADKDGTIEAAENVKTDFDGSGLAIAPTTNTLTLGSSTFYLFLGNADTRKNVIAVCASEICGADLGDDGVLFAESVDNSIDGTIGSNAGRVVGTTGLTGVSATWVAHTPTTPYMANWTSAAKAILYFFDRKP
ncbi:MAG: prepilin-type N-terminal cleavage/methylation domain-containing protein [Nitrospirota bacterium]